MPTAIRVTNRTGLACTVQVLDNLSSVQAGMRCMPQIYTKNSMDRFGDDLCALLLSYLSLEDRFQYECVSKQFQRTVFGSVVDIDINDKLINKTTQQKATIKQLFSRIATKCVNIQTIDCRGMSKMCESLLPEVLTAFWDNSKNLDEIYCNLYENLDQLFDSIGTTLSQIYYISSPENQWFIHCHQLSRLRVHSIADAFVMISGQLMAKNLDKFYLNDYSSDDQNLLSNFVAHNQCLTSVNVIICNDESIYKLTAQLSRLTQLRRLSLGEMDDHFLDNCDKHWPRLQYLSISYYHMTRRCLSHISRLPALQTLSIQCHRIEYDMTQQMKHLTSLNAMDDNKPQPQLYALNSMDRFGDDLFGLILTYLSLEDRFRCDKQLVDGFGQLVTRISLSSIKSNKLLLYCPRASHLRVNSLADIFDTTSGQLLAKNLKQFQFTYNPSDNQQLLYTFVAENKCLQSLVHDSTLHAAYLRSIGMNCKQLVRLSLVLKARSKAMVNQTLDSLRFFPRLKRLQLTVFVAIYGNSIGPLSQCKALTLPALQMLVIEGVGSVDLSDNDFCDLLSRSPKLKSIEIRKIE
ncbi:unnamed protein product [Medioppia subpectinata]|uniref:F-box domain-containing protein n=1 Tax=Medioppia subpectinata TaxID=1979941 RepID=A0A7R9KLH1_9ACAR|nr:unnamed protein product [Medioppia subpectinata]CAG2105808.1 unnamed protein product [Medioppia subpectinata]